MRSDCSPECFLRLIEGILTSLVAGEKCTETSSAGVSGVETGHPKHGRPDRAAADSATIIDTLFGQRG